MHPSIATLSIASATLLARCLAPLALVLGLGAAPALAESAYSKIDYDVCELVWSHAETGDRTVRCQGFRGIPVFVSDVDARMTIDYGAQSDFPQGFFAFNAIGDTIEWVHDEDGVYAAIIRYFISVDGREAQALVVSRVAEDGMPGCMIGVIDARTEQSNGAARGMAATARSFQCGEDHAAVLAGSDSLVRGVSR